MDHHRGLRQVARTIERGNHNGGGTIYFHCAIEETQRFVHPAGIQVAIHIDQFPLDGMWVVMSVAALGNRDLSEVFAGAAVDVLVTLGPHGHPLWRSHVALRCVELSLPTNGQG